MSERTMRFINVRARLAWVGVLAIPACVLAPSAARSLRGPDIGIQTSALLKSRCLACHGPTRREGGFSLQNREAALRKSDSGEAIRLDKPGESPLLQRLLTSDAKHRMPLGGEALTPREIDLVRRWIWAGAPWPPQEKAAPTHWAFVAPKAAPVPTIRNAQPAMRNPVDAFIGARLEKEGLRPSPEADRRTLIRRLSLDLTGLLQTPEEVNAFLADRRPDAYERVVDRLLASPHFGERWGRHWLDLARYADTDGYENDADRPNAWRWRDWVIDAYNRDLPFDQFTIEQIAGDLLPNATPTQRMATGFHRNALYNSAGGADKEEFRTKTVKDRVNAVGTVWLGLTVQCAQCHSHKYDPLTQREYYGLYAFFNSTDDVDVALPGGVAPGIAERKESRPTNVQLRGDFLRPGDAVQPHTAAFLPRLTVASAAPTRLDLARWLVSPENPLTARVVVNRTWQMLFGQPLVPTPENFGKNGAPPTHPELLDWLASVFTTETRRRGELGAGLGWSRKALIRLLVTSAAYRQSSSGNRLEAVAKDPRNRWYWRQNRMRVEAEIVRDLALDASGLLQRRIGGPFFQPTLPAGLTSLPELKREHFTEATKGPHRYRRSVYAMVQRTFPHPTLAVFDTADTNVSCTRRERSNTPLQALTLLNDPTYVEAAQALARRVLREVPATAAGETSLQQSRLRRAFTLCLSRLPDAEEERRLLTLLNGHLERYQASPEPALQAAGEPPLPEGATVAEVAAWTGVARTLLNLDAFITRE
jgi:mono/diheme cytochrome c family protein